MVASMNLRCPGIEKWPSYCWAVSNILILYKSSSNITLVERGGSREVSFYFWVGGRSPGSSCRLHWQCMKRKGTCCLTPHTPVMGINVLAPYLDLGHAMSEWGRYGFGSPSFSSTRVSLRLPAWHFQVWVEMGLQFLLWYWTSLFCLYRLRLSWSLG